ncbi:hypothetical protein [uncultured Parabacteroides sp.]|uniref:hypothetical protein n=1 Tax=uncultured Parabacteroides sp. TaxID=512312 RepID=UPI0025943887|nr:hypothetical protein [uncultured Parabacteroides sp.]
MKTRLKRLPDCLRWKNCFFSLCVASITIIVLLVISCRSTEKISNTSVIDSLTWNKKFSASLVIIPPSLAELTIPMDSLRRLPQGAVYSEKQGQATVTASRKNDKIVITASCDSLQNLCYQYEEELVRIRDQLQKEQTKKEPVIVPFLSKCKWTAFGFLLAIIILSIIKIFKIWQDKKVNP